MTAQPSLNGLYHFAYPCRDAEQTRAFYEDLVGIPLVHCMMVEDTVPSTGEAAVYAHVFFKLRDNSYLAFFDLGTNETPEKSPNTPDWVEHIAFEVDDVPTVLRHKERLEAAGVEVRGLVDHEFVQSIYFFDPNGLRIEINARSEWDGFAQQAEAEAHEALAKWTAAKAARLAA